LSRAGRPAPLPSDHCDGRLDQIRIVERRAAIRPLHGVLEADPDVAASFERGLDHRPRRESLAVMEPRRPRVLDRPHCGLDADPAREPVIAQLETPASDRLTETKSDGTAHAATRSRRRTGSGSIQIAVVSPIGMPGHASRTARTTASQIG
jgi:hypothetical protein